MGGIFIARESFLTERLLQAGGGRNRFVRVISIHLPGFGLFVSSRSFSSRESGLAAGAAAGLGAAATGAGAGALAFGRQRHIDPQGAGADIVDDRLAVLSDHHLAEQAGMIARRRDLVGLDVEHQSRSCPW